MSDEEADPRPWTLIIFLMLVTGGVVGGVADTLETDKQVLLDLKARLEDQNRVNRGLYTKWNQQSWSPCDWLGISCDANGSRVTGINLSDNDIAGEIFGNFSALTALAHLDLSKNTISGAIPADLGRCQSLRFLNLSHNMINGELNLTGMSSLEVLDLSVNRISGQIQLGFPAICQSLIVANVSGNNFTGDMGSPFDGCPKLQYLDLSSNIFTGGVWPGLARLLEFSVSENLLGGMISPSIFPENCSLQVLDLSENFFLGKFPGEISNCKDLWNLNIWGNNFTGSIPAGIGSISGLEALFLGRNNFSREIPNSLLGLTKLVFLDLSKNNFGGDIQTIFGQFRQVKFLLLHGNSYSGGINSSGILRLQNLSRLDLSSNNFSGELPVEISQMMSLQFLILAHNDFSGKIPSEYGNLQSLQALDLSFNRLSGSIPPSFGNLSSLLWLMLANNSLSGEIPKELGDCRSLLWLHLANNQLSGKIPPELTRIGSNPMPTFEMNRQGDRITAGSGECLTMRRWIPADYPPFNFVYTFLTRKNCRSLWDRLLKGYSIFPVCVAGSSVSALLISGYIQLCGNQLWGGIPPEIGRMHNFSMLHLAANQFNATVPPEIAMMPLVVLNISQNQFSGEIPKEIGSIKCLRNLDLSYNNFSGAFPSSINNLNDLSRFNISYNQYITGEVPTTGQLATFDRDSFLGDPLLRLPPFINSSTDHPPKSNVIPRRQRKFGRSLVVLASVLAFLVCGSLAFIVCLVSKNGVDLPGYLLEDTKGRHDLGSSSNASSPWLSDGIKVIRLDKTAFTHADILKATGNFSDGRIIGRGGFGTVYRGTLPDGREVAVKKLQREGIEGEKGFRAEMEVLSGNCNGWPHPNLVTLYGWCLDGSEKLLVYEFMEGGSLEDLVSDRAKLTWRRRIDVALDVARALVFLHHECFPAIVHRDVKASNVLLDKDGKARVTDFGLARMVDVGDSHVSTMVAGTVGYVAPEYGQTWQATTKGDVYSYGVLAMELATGRPAIDEREECLVEWAARVMSNEQQEPSGAPIPLALTVSGLAEGAEEMSELLRIGIRCTAEVPQARPNMKEVLAMLTKISGSHQHIYCISSPPPL